MNRERMASAGALSSRAIAFRRLAGEQLDASYRLAHAILGNRAEAEDAIQDAIVRAWRHWPQLRDESRFEPWFHRILINTCRSRLRTSRRTQAEDLSPELVVSDGDPIAGAEDREQMRAALAGLSVDHRIVVALRYYRDLPIEEIAIRLGVPAGTVSSRLHHALRHLRAALAEPSRAGAER